MRESCSLEIRGQQNLKRQIAQERKTGHRGDRRTKKKPLIREESKPARTSRDYDSMRFLLFVKPMKRGWSRLFLFFSLRPRDLTVLPPPPSAVSLSHDHHDLPMDESFIRMAFRRGLRIEENSRMKNDDQTRPLTQESHDCFILEFLLSSDLWMKDRNDLSFKNWWLTFTRSCFTHSQVDMLSSSAHIRANYEMTYPWKSIQLQYCAIERAGCLRGLLSSQSCFEFQGKLHDHPSSELRKRNKKNKKKRNSKNTTHMSREARNRTYKQTNKFTHPPTFESRHCDCRSISNKTKKTWTQRLRRLEFMKNGQVILKKQSKVINWRASKGTFLCVPTSHSSGEVVDEFHAAKS